MNELELRQWCLVQAFEHLGKLYATAMQNRVPTDAAPRAPRTAEVLQFAAMIEQFVETGDAPGSVRVAEGHKTTNPDSAPPTHQVCLACFGRGRIRKVASSTEELRVCGRCNGDGIEPDRIGGIEP